MERHIAGRRCSAYSVMDIHVALTHTLQRDYILIAACVSGCGYIAAAYMPRLYRGTADQQLMSCVLTVSPPVHSSLALLTAVLHALRIPW